MLPSPNDPAVPVVLDAPSAEVVALTKEDEDPTAEELDASDALIGGSVSEDVPAADVAGVSGDGAVSVAVASEEVAGTAGPVVRSVVVVLIVSDELPLSVDDVLPVSF